MSRDQAAGPRAKVSAGHGPPDNVPTPSLDNFPGVTIPNHIWVVYPLCVGMV